MSHIDLAIQMTIENLKERVSEGSVTLSGDGVVMLDRLKKVRVVMGHGISIS